VASGKLVGAVAGAIKILRYLAEAREPVGVSRIAKETKLNTSTTFNILRTLMLDDFVQFDQLSKTYLLSLGIMDIAHGAAAISGDVGMILRMMERVANAHGVTVTLWQPVRRDRKVLIMAAHTRNAMRIQMTVGQRLPLLIGATGRIFAAFSDMSREELRRQFNAIRWDNPLTFEGFMAQVAETRETGWAIDEGNFFVGTVLVSTPIFDREGHATMAVTANMFAGQYNLARRDEIVRDLKSLSDQAARIVAA
jgi:DNA-binding IclR family transcriptional regulator